MSKINVKIKGVSPYIQNKFFIGDGSESKRKGANTPTPEEDAKRKVYENENGYFIPSEQIKVAMVNCASQFKYQGMKTYKEYIKSGVFFTNLEIPLLHEYEHYSVPVRIGNARVVTTRPIFKVWDAEFTIDIVDDTLDNMAIKEILETAGKYKGIGDRRPEYGRFEVVKFQEL